MQFPAKHITVLLVAALFCFLWPTQALSQSRLSIRVSDARPGDTVVVPVVGALQSPVDTAVIAVRYNANRLALLDVRAGQSFSLGCNPLTWTDSVSGDLGFTSVFCDSFATANGDSLCALVFEVLAGRDEFAQIEPLGLRYGNQVQSPVLESGGVRVDDRPVVPILVDDLKPNFPNPFAFETTFPYSTVEATRITFRVYNTLGQVLKTFDPIDRQRGAHTFVFRVTELDNFASGIFYLVMETDRGTFRRSFVHVR